MRNGLIAAINNAAKYIISLPIIRGIIGGAIGADLALAIPATFALMSGHWMDQPYIFPVAVVLGVAGGTIGIAVAGIPCMIIGFGIGVTEQFRKCINKNLLLMWLAITPGIFALIAAIITVSLLPHDEILWIEVVMIGIIYSIVRIVEIYLLKSIRSVAFWALVSVSCYYVSDMIILNVAGIRDYQRPFAECIVLFSIVVCQKMYNGLAIVSEKVRNISTVG